LYRNTPYLVGLDAGSKDSCCIRLSNPSGRQYLSTHINITSYSSKAMGMTSSVLESTEGETAIGGKDEEKKKRRGSSDLEEVHVEFDSEESLTEFC
jgi:hypothetical protein